LKINKLQAYRNCSSR